MGYGFGSAALASVVLFSWLGTNVRALFCICAVVVIITASMTLRGAKEQQLRLPEDIRAPTVRQVMKRMWHGIKNTPKPIARAFWVQFWSYFAWDCTFIYGSDWMGRVVYGGDPEADEDSPEYRLFYDGVTAANLGFLLMALISIGWGLALPWACRRCPGGIRVVWGACLLLLCILLFSTTAVGEGQRGQAVFLFALLGFPKAVAYQIPWSIVTVTLAADGQEQSSTASQYDLGLGNRRGLYTTIFNLSQASPEILVSLLGGPCIYVFNGHLTSVLVMGGLGALAAVGLCVRVLEPPTLYNRHASDTRKQSMEMPPVHTDQEASSQPVQSLPAAV
uniref:Uncharacterized protein n=1 Tax=Fibrocapsa japonica TaxID=94617 RepID=A0A7S2XZ65_9STRA|mmetsp:Transcript_23810/g.34635  ORF Transcript_23810/g.34635 Transcript_23810/m.34635 type:complete len:335 (+) Transcript_23810:1-1005(+)